MKLAVKRSNLLGHSALGKQHEQQCGTTRKASGPCLPSADGRGLGCSPSEGQKVTNVDWS